jgi:hypothetical protein
MFNFAVFQECDSGVKRDLPTLWSKCDTKLNYRKKTKVYKEIYKICDLDSHDRSYVTVYWDKTLCSVVDVWFYPEDGGSGFLKNVSIYYSLHPPDNTASYTRQ